MRPLLIPALVSLPLVAAAPAKVHVDALNETFAAAMVRGDAAAVAACYTEDAHLFFFKGATVKGRAAIQETLGGMFKGMKVKSMKVVSEECHALGDLILDQGTYEMVNEAGDKTETSRARYFQVLKKGKDGRYLLFRDCPLTD